MSEILCRGCAAFGGCKLEKKGTATKCRNHWTHIPTANFTEIVEKIKVTIK